MRKSVFEWIEFIVIIFWDTGGGEGEINLLCHNPNSCPCILFARSIGTTCADHLRRMSLSNRIWLSSATHFSLSESPVAEERKYLRNDVRIFVYLSSISVTVIWPNSSANKRYVQCRILERWKLVLSLLFRFFTVSISSPDWIVAKPGTLTYKVNTRAWRSSL